MATRSSTHCALAVLVLKMDLHCIDPVPLLSFTKASSVHKKIPVEFHLLEFELVCSVLALGSKITLKASLRSTDIQKRV
jgi:hypothetical protein